MRKRLMVEHYRISKDKSFPQAKICACIGYFDGMHRGHQALISEARSAASKNRCRSALICFDPDPFKVIFGYENEHLFPISERKKLCERFGVDVLIEIEFDEQLMKMEPASFVSEYLNKLNLAVLVCGYDFSFGDKGKGSFHDLCEYGNFKTMMVPEKDLYGLKISSTRIKKAVKEGNFRLVRRLLGYEYYFILKVKKSYPDADKWLTEAVLADESCVLPKEKDYGFFALKNKKFYIRSDHKFSKGQIIDLDTEYE